MSIRARKSDYCEDWHIEQEIPCINGLRCWFVVATAEESCSASMGYTDGAFGSAEDRANKIVAGLEREAHTSATFVAGSQQTESYRDALQGIANECKRWLNTQPTSDGASKGWALHLQMMAETALTPSAVGTLPEEE